MVLQGRNREMEKFAPFMYKPGASFMAFGGLPMYDGSEWAWGAGTDLILEDKGVEQFKTHFYTLEGWDTTTGYPNRKTLEDLGMKNVADVLQAKGKLGSG